MNTTKRNIFKIGIVCLAIALISGVIGYTLAQTGNTFYITQGIYPNAVFYTIYKEGSIYYAKNSYGHIDYYGTNASQIINNARSSLTSSRTFEETILIKGDINLTNPILISSYTNLIIDGKITLVNGFPSNTGAIQNLDQTNGNTNIDVTGGQIDGNKEGQTGTNIYGVFFRQVDDSKILNININRTKSSGIYVSLGSDRNIIQGNTITYSGYAGIVVEGDVTSPTWTTDNRVIANTVKYNDKDGITIYRYALATIVSENIANNNGQNPDFEGGGSGIRVDNVCDKSLIENNIANNNDYDGIQIINSKDVIVNGNIANQNGNVAYTQVNRGDGIEVWDNSWRTIITSNQANENKRQGIVINGESYASIVSNNQVRANGWSGIRVYRTPKVTISGNIAMDNGQVLNITEADGIKVDDEGEGSIIGRNVTITGNICLNSIGTTTQKYGIEIKDSYDYNIIIANDCRTNANASYDIVYSGTHNKVAYNQGRYVQQGSA